MSLMTARRTTVECQLFSGETSSSKVVSIKKGAFNNEKAIGPLAVARQLPQHYFGKSRSTGREIQRERRATVF